MEIFEIVNNIVDKIKEAPVDTELTIAKLINYNPEVDMVDPLTQGEVLVAVKSECEKDGIVIEEIESGFGGLAYNYPFKKVDLKLSNGKYAVNKETKEAFEKYMEEVKKFNEKIERGEDPGIKQGDLLAKYREQFYDESLEEKLKKNEEEFKNRKNDEKIDDLIKKIDEKLEHLKNLEDQDEMK